MLLFQHNYYVPYALFLNLDVHDLPHSLRHSKKTQLTSFVYIVGRQIIQIYQMLHSGCILYLS